MNADTLELPIPPGSVVSLSLGAGFRKRLANPRRPFPSTVLPPRRTKRPRHARRVPESRGYKATNAVLWCLFVAVVPPMLALLGGPFIYEVRI